MISTQFVKIFTSAEISSKYLRYGKKKKDISSVNYTFFLKSISKSIITLNRSTNTL